MRFALALKAGSELFAINGTGISSGITQLSYEINQKVRVCRYQRGVPFLAHLIILRIMVLPSSTSTKVAGV